jgi:hypothetical protein
MSLQKAKTVCDLYTTDMEENQNIERVLSNENEDFRLFIIDKICLETITYNLSHHIQGYS